LGKNGKTLYSKEKLYKTPLIHVFFRFYCPPFSCWKLEHIGFFFQEIDVFRKSFQFYQYMSHLFCSQRHASFSIVHVFANWKSRYFKILGWIFLWNCRKFINIFPYNEALVIFDKYLVDLISLLEGFNGKIVSFIMKRDYIRPILSCGG
jgi:hypothetical protein